MNISSHILRETPDWIAVNKPAGLLSIPDREGKEISLKKLLKEKYGDIYTVHRLDRETSGVIIFARNEEAHRELNVLFENRETEKIYYGLVVGTPLQKKGSVNSPIAEHPAKKGMMVVHRNGRDALTDYEVVQELGSWCWMRFRIHTGRTHQIRVHCREIGHPIAVDPLYGDGKPVLLSQVKRNFRLSLKDEEERPLLSRLALHAAQLRFTFKGEVIELEAELPKDLRVTLKQLEKNR